MLCDYLVHLLPVILLNSDKPKPLLLYEWCQVLSRKQKQQGGVYPSSSLASKTDVLTPKIPVLLHLLHTSPRELRKRSVTAGLY